MRSKVIVRSSTLAAGSHSVESANHKNRKLRIDLKWREMRSKVIIGHPIMAQVDDVQNRCRRLAILIKNQKKKLRNDREMCQSMHSKVIFGHPKWHTAAIYVNHSKYA